MIPIKSTFKVALARRLAIVGVMLIVILLLRATFGTKLLYSMQSRLEPFQRQDDSVNDIPRRPVSIVGEKDSSAQFPAPDPISPDRSDPQSENVSQNAAKSLCANPRRLGDEYGGWTICIPDNHNLNGSIVYSVGIGRNIMWDKAMIRTYGTVHHGFDPTPTASDFFSKDPPPPGFTFHKYGLGTTDGKVFVKLPVGNQDSYTVLNYSAKAQPGTVLEIDVLKLDTMLEKLGHRNIEILKADIEGAEFDVIADWANRNYRPPVRQILIEFHDRYFPNGRAMLDIAVRQMEKIGFALLHKQKNWERTFVRVDKETSD